MPDSVPDPKVEDVLSSVRRLVSQEVPRRRPQSRGLPGVPTPSGALVLTASDRVEKDHAARASARSLEQKIAELEAAVDGTADEFEPDGSEDQSLHRPDRIVYTRPRPSEETAGRTRSTLRLSEIALIETGPSDDEESDSDDPVAFRSEHGFDDEAPMATDVPPVPPVSAEVRAFTDPDDVVARIEARIERGPDAAPETDKYASDADRFDAELSAAVRKSIAESSSEQDRGMSAGANASDARQAVRTGAALDPKPVEPPMGKVPGTTTADTSSDRPVARSSADEEPQPEAAQQIAGAKAALDRIPEEDALRLLVSRLMKQELQGDLGERITHTVRKLVRSEIQRVLDSRDLD
ncbi:MAG: hypothetical protein LJE62_05090 [Silicimonas sp.]|nr:hypothetical protein [Silicimonas sp.]